MRDEIIVVENKSKVGRFGTSLAGLSLLWIVVVGMLIGFHVLPSNTMLMPIGIWGLVCGWGLMWKNL